ncbi:GTA TIM-barrel-like domain protein [Orientia chuto str. Dubai]|uniref:GTA TIM-barrel-like domain protein n=1 Tax=Orientia chuto str. Dubai TaxID=1359168 RepID=A0A0F3MK30_9RICK|nr:glycoside hydrolase TIM-barrel-like domain-containing protein [Candidatus Orientia mediorientalis]KJV56118.1 GTA TIM-barrel-like domain protein [Orientia chuto str. Dubai]
MENNSTPAFRGLAYIVFKNIKLNDFNNKIPIFSFEVTRHPNVNYSKLKNINNTADLIQSIAIIPGSGEFILDPQIQYKCTHNNKVAVNCHNNLKLANSVVSLNQLLNTCSNLKWIAPVVCWFGTNLEADKCKVLPKVEYYDYGPKWQVADYNRNEAPLISKDFTGNLRYGGSINDQSLLRYLALLKSKQLKIMLYPIIMMDINGKPWRGNIHAPQCNTALNTVIATFFRGGKEYTTINPKKGSYNYFILHYAKLALGKVDAFIIGSELKNLTSVYNSFSKAEKFPAVLELIELAKAVKSILGNQVLVSYAADWSEYHHVDTNDGHYYHLDILWACEAIDFVGIDAYFPLTHTQDSNIDIKEIKHGWESGEGYDYYFDNNQPKKFDNVNLAWKNIRHWWSQHHIDSNGQKTVWAPKMKPIWFTEFGIPSVDKATNQPNIFFDSNSNAQQYLKYSTGAVDFLIQSKAIKATLEYWQQHSDMVKNIFLWAWDARPYPTWPTNTYWQDRALWETGHWINGKLTGTNLAAIVTELCTKSGIDIVDVTSINDEAAGFLITKNHKAINIINMLRCCYFFDIKTSATNKISFVVRNHKTNLYLSVKQCVIQSCKAPVNYAIISQNQILNNINLTFINTNNYCLTTYNYASKDHNQPYNLNLPVVTSIQHAQNICQTILKNANIESIVLNFALPIRYIYLEVSDIIVLSTEDMEFIVRITNIKYFQLIIIITAVGQKIEN